ncbi:glycosyl hydrolase [Citrobacter koseri]|uniref:Glycosyl hydrolase n=1 Tax=Citrobacter koseri TaxID=545 RepID=A0A2X2WEY2_CITKO|nr:glycosyl hydrolase [Citrobacter koseri]
MNFDFSAPEYHELALWEDNATLRFECADSYIALLEKLTALLGRQPVLPDWVYDGVTLGIQGGTDVCQQKLDTMRNAGVKVNGIWAQDLVRHPHDLFWQTRDVELEVEQRQLSSAGYPYQAVARRRRAVPLLHQSLCRQR